MLERRASGGFSWSSWLSWLVGAGRGSLSPRRLVVSARAASPRRYENMLAAPAEAADDDGRFDDAEEEAEADEDKETGQAR